MAKPGSPQAREIARNGRSSPSRPFDASKLERLIHDFESSAATEGGDALATVIAAQEFAREFPPELAKLRRHAGMTPVPVNGSRSRGLAAGYFQITLRDGSLGYFQRRTDDCIQAVIASLLQMPPHLVPDLHFDEQRFSGTDPEETDRDNDEQFRQWTRKHGLTIVYHAKPPTWAKRWIGMVTTGNPCNESHDAYEWHELPV